MWQKAALGSVAAPQELQVIGCLPQGGERSGNLTTRLSARTAYNGGLIDVIASITIKPGCRDQFVKRFLENVPHVLAEDGCVHYYPTVDIETGIGVQAMDPNVVTVVEQWESVEHLHAHLQAPHMLTYREDVKDWVEGASIKVLTKA